MEEQSIKIERFDNEKYKKVRELVEEASTPPMANLNEITKKIVDLFDEGTIKFSVVAPRDPSDREIRTEIEVDSYLFDDIKTTSDTIKTAVFTSLKKMDREFRNLGRERYWASVNEKVVELADKGYSNAEISGRLAISENTVRAIKVNAPRDRKKAEFSELEAITNPAVKKRLLEAFGDVSEEAFDRVVAEGHPLVLKGINQMLFASKVAEMTRIISQTIDNRVELELRAANGEEDLEMNTPLQASNTVRKILKLLSEPIESSVENYAELEAIATEKLYVDALEQTSKRNNLSAMFRDVLVSFTGLDRNVPELEIVSEAFADKVLDQIIGEPEAPRSKISKLTNEDLKNIEDIVRDAIANAKATKVGKEDLVVRTMARIIRSL